MTSRIRLGLLGLVLIALLCPWHYLQALNPPAQTLVLNFNGNQIAQTFSGPSLTLGDTFTIECWVFPTSNQPGAVFLGKPFTDRGTDPFMDYVLEFGAGGQFEFVETTGQPGSYRGITAPSEAPVNVWSHVAGTLENGTMRLYVNGVLVASGASVGPPQSDAVPFGVGAGASLSGGIAQGGFSGSIRQVRVWSRALSDAELTANAGVYLSGQEAGLLNYWPLDDGAGQTAHDLGPNQNLLQLGSATTSDDNDPRWLPTDLNDNPYFSVETVSLPAGVTAQLGRLIDINLDGYPDVLLADADFENWSPRPLRALFNDGGGHFSDATAAAFANQTITMIAPRNFVVADLDGDGRTDVLIAEQGPDGPPFLPDGGQNKLLLHTPAGTLVDATANLPTDDSFTHSVAAADIDNRNSLSVYVGNICCGDFGPGFYMNDGTGHFTFDQSRAPALVNGTKWTDPAYISSLVVDVNIDGKPDLVVGAGGGTLSPTTSDLVLINDGTGHFTVASTPLPPRSGGSTWLTVYWESADFDGNGWPDLLANITNNYNGQNKLQLLLNNQDGTFRDASDRLPQTDYNLNAGGAFLSYAVAFDVNDDELPDLLISGWGFNILLINVEGTHFIDASYILPPVHPVLALVGDLDQNGSQDIFVIGGGSAFYVMHQLRRFPTTPKKRRGQLISE